MELQEVQKKDNRYKESDKIVWIWYIERKLSYKTQIRDKENTGWWVTELTLATATAVDPWNTGKFDNSSIASWGKGWSITDWWKVYPTPWRYILTRYVSTNNINRELQEFLLRVLRNGSYVYVRDDGNGKDDYYWTTAFEFLPWDELRLQFSFTWGSTSSNIGGRLRFIQF